MIRRAIDLLIVEGTSAAKDPAFWIFAIVVYLVVDRVARTVW